MKYLIPLIAITLFSSIANSAAIFDPNGPYYNDGGSNLLCIRYAPYCPPHQRMWNRSHTKIIAEYQPSYPKIYSWANMQTWRIGNASQGLTNQDWQDIEDAKVKSGGYWRWGICWPGAHPATICLN